MQPFAELVALVLQMRLGFLKSRTQKSPISCQWNGHEWQASNGWYEPDLFSFFSVNLASNWDLNPINGLLVLSRTSVLKLSCLVQASVLFMIGPSLGDVNGSSAGLGPEFLWLKSLPSSSMIMKPYKDDGDFNHGNTCSKSKATTHNYPAIISMALPCYHLQCYLVCHDH